MVGDGDSTEDITLALVFLFSREGAVLTAALEEHHNVDVLLLPKEKELGHGENQNQQGHAADTLLYTVVIASKSYYKTRTNQQSFITYLNIFRNKSSIFFGAFKCIREEISDAVVLF